MIEQTEKEVVLDAQGVSKSYGAVRALQDASLSLRRGEIVALMGANGAGKSTLVKILTGALKPDSGAFLINGVSQIVANPKQARRSGLVPVYQEPSLIPDLTVGDNLRLVATPVEPFLKWVEALGIEKLSLDDQLGRLPLATLRILDLARALAAEPEVLLLDEMTAALPTDLVEHVLKVVRKQADNGLSVIYVSHRFAEIAAMCDRATVLRDGSTVGDVVIEDGIEEEIVSMMLGAALSRSAGTAQNRVAADAPVRFEARDVCLGNKLHDVSFELRKGQVLGVIALEGQGQDELFEVLAGLERPDKGSIFVDAIARTFRHPADAIAAGVTFVPGNRADALLHGRSVLENISLPAFAKSSSWGPINTRREFETVEKTVERMQIDRRAMGEVQQLSGGNQQKVTIGRWLTGGVETLLLFDPTRGIDVRTKRQVYDLVGDLAADGASILFYTSELDEIQMACDRVMVIFNGRVVTFLDVADASESNLMRAAYGLLTGRSEGKEANT